MTIDYDDDFLTNCSKKILRLATFNQKSEIRN
jgi:hypothetical protein